MKNNLMFLLLFVAVSCLSSCAVVGGIFKAGVWVGILIVVLVIALIIYLMGKAGGK